MKVTHLLSKLVLSAGIWQCCFYQRPILFKRFIWEGFHCFLVGLEKFYQRGTNLWRLLQPLTQPWATLVVTGAKRLETRSWTTTYRGPLLIHAAKRYPSYARSFTISIVGLRPSELPFGAVIGRVVLKSIRPTVEVAPYLTDLERLYGDYTPGRWAWELEEAVRFAQPIPWRGALKLFQVTLLAVGGVPWEGPTTAAVQEGGVRRCPVS